MHIHSLHPSLPVWMAALESRLASVFADDDATLRQAGLLAVSSPGKRLRPVLALLSCAACGEVTNRAIDGAAMVELIHTASLVHDDVVDKAQSRRGAPSAPARWGNTFSVLLGDYLFARVFELATTDGDPALLHLLSTTAKEMARGIVLEMTALTIDATEETYWQVVRGKTAALFAASAACGALTAGADPEQRQAMYRMGMAFGLAFQLADDLMDLQGREEEIGKPLGVDWSHRHATLPLLHALSAAPADAVEAMRALWQHDPFTAEELDALKCLVAAHDGFEYCWRKVKEYQREACHCLLGIPPGPGRDALVSLCGDAFPLPVLPVPA